MCILLLETEKMTIGNKKGPDIPVNPKITNLTILPLAKDSSLLVSAA